MKKVLFLLVALFTLTVSAQTYTHNSKVRVKTTTAAAPTDNIVSIDANGELKRTSQTVSDIGGVAPNLQTVLDTGNTSTTGVNLIDCQFNVSSGSNSSNVNQTGVTVIDASGNIRVTPNYIRKGEVGNSFGTLLTFSPLNSVASVNFRNISGTVALTSELTGAQNLQSVTTEGSTTTLGIETGSYTTQSGTHLVELYPTSLAMYEYAGNKYTEVSPSIMSVSNATGSTSVQSSGVTILEGGNPKAELTKDDLRLYKGANYGSIQASASLGANRTYTMPDKDINVAGLKDIVTFVGNETVEHTNASLNTKYPIANYPIGTMEVLRFTSGVVVKVRLYVRVTSTEWVDFTGSSL